ncbi:acyl carrier protein [Pseudomonas soli]|uniref:acyl carrier protein n=2 Tax=Pseudomonas soli TaxID=1306993 RepID=UPI0011B5ADD6|nr:acyl carrier protein [Pseudomonas soli]
MRSRLYVTLGLHWTIAYVLEQSPHRIRPDITLCELGADSFDMVELQALVEEALALQLHWQIRNHITFTELVDLCARRCVPTSAHPDCHHLIFLPGAAKPLRK